MSDDLVNRLKSPEVFLMTSGGISPVAYEAADRIEKLEMAARGVPLRDMAALSKALDRIAKLGAALHQWDDLIRHQYSGSREAMSDLTEAAQITAALLHGDEPWPETRIEKLEAALREIVNKDTFGMDWAVRTARKALDAK